MKPNFKMRFNCTPDEYVDAVVDQIVRRGGFTADPEAWPVEVQRLMAAKVERGQLLVETAGSLTTYTMNTNQEK